MNLHTIGIYNAQRAFHTNTDMYSTNQFYCYSKFKNFPSSAGTDSSNFAWKKFTATGWPRRCLAVNSRTENLSRVASLWTWFEMRLGQKSSCGSNSTLFTYSFVISDSLKSLRPPFCSNNKNTYRWSPVPRAGTAPTSEKIIIGFYRRSSERTQHHQHSHSVRTSPLSMLSPGMLPTIQCCHERNFGASRLGASGSMGRFRMSTVEYYKWLWYWCKVRTNHK